MLRDVFAYIQQQTLGNMPTPGLSAVSPSLGATGTVVLSGVALGTFYGRLEVLTSGALGTATAQLSFNAAFGFTPAFQVPFTIPVGGAYAVPLEQPGSIVFALPSGFVLTFSGTFTEGDFYTFTVSAAPDFRVGEEQRAAADKMFPAITFVPETESFVGTEDFAGTKTYLNAPKAVAMGVNIISAECWGIDYDRAELLKNQLIYGIRNVPSPAGILSGRWMTDQDQQNKTGRTYVLQFNVRIPVVQLDAVATEPLAPPHNLTITPQVSH